LDSRPLLEHIYRAAIAGAQPEGLVACAIDASNPSARRLLETLAPARSLYLVAAGKAAAGMTAALLSHFGPRLRDGVTIVPKGGGHIDLPGVRCFSAGHPLPDVISLEAASAVRAMLARVTEHDAVLVALSGGASSLMVMPAEGLTLADKLAANEVLLRSGASIQEINAVRKHLSAFKGGGLLRYVKGAPVISLILSDVLGDDLATIASGPTAADPTTFADAIAVLKRHDIWDRVPERIRDHLEKGAAGEINETIKVGDPALARVMNVVIGNNQTALNAASRVIESSGFSISRWHELKGDVNPARIGAGVAFKHDQETQDVPSGRWRAVGHGPRRRKGGQGDASGARDGD
jgi:glycerate 2-kinase